MSNGLCQIIVSKMQDTKSGNPHEYGLSWIESKLQYWIFL
uniref:Uncharacterized protein n=1 Tax=Anguilla anguilla TaxID=7936 RepID=A0A0E9VAI8_ANGAN